MPSSLSSRVFGRLPDGRTATLYTLTNSRGHVVTLTDYGAAIVSLFVPDRDGRVADVVLGFDDLAGYLSADNPYFGSIIGRLGNRLAMGRFTLDGVTHQLATNNGPHHLHGGLRGFDKLLWTAAPSRENPPALTFTLRSPDGDEGYPGNLDVRVTYTWEHDDTLRIDYQATTDRATPVNLTNHVYLNLAGAGRGDVLKHRIQINADHFTPVDPTLIPTGKIAPVAGTLMDFREPGTVGDHITEVGDKPRGYDHNYVLRPRADASPALAAEVTDPSTGRRLRVLTTEPGVQFYTGNFLDGEAVGKGGTAYAQYTGFCLETQHFPDAPNQPAFPNVVLRPGETYRTSTLFRFDTV